MHVCSSVCLSWDCSFTFPALLLPSPSKRRHLLWVPKIQYELLLYPLKFIWQLIRSGGLEPQEVYKIGFYISFWFTCLILIWLYESKAKAGTISSTGKWKQGLVWPQKPHLPDNPYLFTGNLWLISTCILLYFAHPQMQTALRYSYWKAHSETCLPVGNIDS